MLIHLSEVLSAAGKRRVYEVQPEMQAFRAGGQKFEVVAREPMRLELVHTEHQKITVTGRIRLTVCFLCDRCLEPVPYSFDISFEKEADMGQSDEERRAELDEQAYIQGFELDTERLLSEELLLHMPMKILCREDCRGICNRCGANLNQGPCHCKEEPKDPRMAAVLDIFKAARK